MGGSMFVHTFGAFFGLACSMIVTKSDRHEKQKKHSEASYSSDMTAMIGTIFLWMFWPSFNGALATGNAQHRVVINTVLALSASALSGYCFSSLLRKDHKFSMVDI